MVSPRARRGSRSGDPHRHPHRARIRRLPDTAFVRAAALFRAAGDVARLRVLHTLAHGEWCVSELAADTGTKLFTLSQQLRVLYSERIVERRRDGKHIYYRLADDHVRDLVAAALEHAGER
jgi:ArsR family transcriptional regulator, lead/cadmium/zinc/bismuth-responsive transcriptional repressor